MLRRYWARLKQEEAAQRRGRVSLIASAVALVRAMGIPRDRAEPRGFLDFIRQMPWEWSYDRLLGFSLMNLGIAAGIGIAFPM